VGRGGGGRGVYTIERRDLVSLAMLKASKVWQDLGCSILLSVGRLLMQNAIILKLFFLYLL